MANKKGGSTKNIDIVDLFSYIAIVFAAVIFLINIILKAIGGNLETVMNVMTIIKDISVLLALGLGGWNFARKHGIVVKIFFYIAIITYIVCAVLGIFNII